MGELKVDQIPKCHLLVDTPFLASMVLFDIVSGIVNGYLFIRPIYKLKALKDISSKLSYVAQKQKVLSITAIVGSIIANFGLAIIDIPQFNAGFDIVISTTCILLMYQWNDAMYRKMCCCCIKKKRKTVNEEKVATEITAGTESNGANSTKSQMSTTDKSEMSTTAAGNASKSQMSTTNRPEMSTTANIESTATVNAVDETTAP